MSKNARDRYLLEASKQLQLFHRYLILAKNEEKGDLHIDFKFSNENYSPTSTRSAIKIRNREPCEINCGDSQHIPIEELIDTPTKHLVGNQNAPSFDNLSHNSDNRNISDEFEPFYSTFDVNDYSRNGLINSETPNNTDQPCSSGHIDGTIPFSSVNYSSTNNSHSVPPSNYASRTHCITPYNSYGTSIGNVHSTTQMNSNFETIPYYAPIRNVYNMYNTCNFNGYSANANYNNSLMNNMRGFQYNNYPTHSYIAPNNFYSPYYDQKAYNSDTSAHNCTYYYDHYNIYNTNNLKHLNDSTQEFVNSMPSENYSDSEQVVADGAFTRTYNNSQNNSNEYNANTSSNCDQIITPLEVKGITELSYNQEPFSILNTDPFVSSFQVQTKTGNNSRSLLQAISTENFQFKNSRKLKRNSCSDSVKDNNYPPKKKKLIDSPSEGRDTSEAYQETSNEISNKIIIRMDWRYIKITPLGNQLHLSIEKFDKQGFLLFNSPLLSDCIITINKATIYYGHKYLLCKSSCYFDAMLNSSSNFNENSELEINIYLEYPELFSCILYYICSGKLYPKLVNWKNEWNFHSKYYFMMLHTATYLQINSLISELENLFDFNFINKNATNSLFRFPLFQPEILLTKCYILYTTAQELGKEVREIAKNARTIFSALSRYITNSDNKIITAKAIEWLASNDIKKHLTKYTSKLLEKCNPALHHFLS